MSLYEILTISICLLSVVLSIVAWLYSKRYKEFQQSKDKAEINSHRNQIESRIYSIQRTLLDDAYNFVDTNKLLIRYASDNSFDNKIPNNSFFNSLGIDFTQLKFVSNAAFCLMPFNKQYYPVYLTIKSACSDLGIICHRSDEHYETGNLLRQIIQYIATAHFIFAVLDGRNPNVFYEIGIAHALGKPVFLIANFSQKDKLPFDIKSSRLILYRNYNDLENLIKKTLISNMSYGPRKESTNSHSPGEENPPIEVSNVREH